METNNQNNYQNIIPNDADKQQKGVNVPNLRFKEYCKNWTIEPMEKICKFFKGRGISKEDLSDTGNPCILYGELYTTYKTAIAKTIKSKTLLDLKSLVHSKSNDVLIPCSGETAEDISTSICIPYDDVLIGGDLTIIRSQLNGAFLSNQINSVRKFDIAKIAQGKSIVHLQPDELKKINISFPMIDEQLKIATFVDLLDQRIDTQSKIIEDLELFKKGIENQYFGCHKNNTFVILGEIITQVNNRNEQNKDFEVLSVSNKYGFIPQSEQFDDHEVASANKSNYKIVKQNDFAYNPARINVGSIAMLRNNHVGIVSPMYICFRSDNNRILSSYLDYFSHSNKFNNEVLKNLEGSVRLCLSFESLSKIKIHLPSLDTQYEIVKDLDLISNKISIENKILVKLKEQKKYLLSNMFI